MAAAAKRVTFRLRRTTVQAMDALVGGGIASSRNALVETLVDDAVRRLRRREREAQAEEVYAQAFGDPAYVAEQVDLGEVFSNADVESLAQADQ